MAAKGTKTVKINLNQMVKKAIHQPRTDTGYALYTHVNNYKDDGTSGDTFDKGALADKEYMAKKDKTYNSPKNIKRLFITGDKVYIQYHTTFFVNGKTEVGTWVSKPLRNSENKSLFQIADSIVEFTEGKTKFDLYNEAGVDNEVVNYEITDGSLFKSLSNGWVLSNIEELYVDWTVLLNGDDAFAVFNSPKTSYEIIKAFRKGNGASSYNKNEALRQLIFNYNHGTNKELIDRFPRLRIVAMVQNLDLVMKHDSMNKAFTKLTGSYEEFKKLWIEVNKNLIDQIGGAVVFCNFNGNQENYKTAENQYLFDSRLKIHFEKYVSDAKRLRREDTYNYSDDGNNNSSDMNELEAKLVQYEKTMTPSKFENLLKISFMNTKGKDKKAMLSEFTKENREKYAKILNVKL